MKTAMLCVVICCLFFLSNVNSSPFFFQCGPNPNDKQMKDDMQDACNALELCNMDEIIITVPAEEVLYPSWIDCVAHGNQKVRIESVFWTNSSVISGTTWSLRTSNSSAGMNPKFTLSGLMFTKCSGGPCLLAKSDYEWLDLSIDDVTIEKVGYEANANCVRGVQLDGYVRADVSNSYFNSIHFPCGVGGAFYVSGNSTLVVDKRNNFTSISGSAIYNDGGKLTIGKNAKSYNEGNMFQFCFGNLQGGAIHNDGPNLKIGPFNSFDSNAAAYCGGAIGTKDFSEFSEDNRFRNNSALVGGAICRHNFTSSIKFGQMKKLRFSKNSAVRCSNIGFFAKNAEGIFNVPCILEEPIIYKIIKENSSTVLYVWIATVFLFIGYVVYKHRQSKRARAERDYLLEDEYDQSGLVSN